MPGDDAAPNQADSQALAQSSGGDCLHIDIKKADDSYLPQPFRIGITANNHDRTQHLKAVVFPQSAAANLSLTVSSGLTLSNKSLPSNGVVTFDVVGNTKSQSKGDAWIDAYVDTVSGDSYDTRPSVSVVVPGQVGTPHDTTGGGLVIANRVLDATTSPAILFLPPGQVELSTIYARFLTITVLDQFGDLIGSTYEGAEVSEFVSADNSWHTINQVLTASSSYSDPVGTREICCTAAAGSSQAQSWPSQPTLPLTQNGSATQNIAVRVDGFDLSPGIVNRTLTVVSSPSSVTISWP